MTSKNNNLKKSNWPASQAIIQASTVRPDISLKKYTYTSDKRGKGGDRMFVPWGNFWIFLAPCLSRVRPNACITIQSCMYVVQINLLSFMVDIWRNYTSDKRGKGVNLLHVATSEFPRFLYSSWLAVALKF